VVRVLDLFSGIGGFSLGLEAAGMQTAMFCEIEPYCRAVLAKHWPGVPIHDDVRTLDRVVVAQKTGPVDLVCGGFPCQNISVAGRGEGLEGDRSRLWFEYRRIIEEIAPRWVVIENVPALRSRGLDVVLGGLAALGYDAEWHCIPASAVGAPHRRDRVWIVANANGDSRAPRALHPGEGSGGRDAGGGGVSEAVADADGSREQQSRGPERQERRRVGDGGEDVAYAEHGGLGWRDAPGPLLGTSAVVPSGWWGAEPDVGRVANGVPSRVDRLRALGNAVVPVIPYIIGQAIMRAEGRA
jgi:DNA (cytosine-5)-methyltransferase 1